jgi:hypothetical protein
MDSLGSLNAFVQAAKPKVSRLRDGNLACHRRRSAKKGGGPLAVGDHGKKVEQKPLGGSQGSLSSIGLVGRSHTDHLL